MGFGGGVVDGCGEGVCDGDGEGEGLGDGEGEGLGDGEGEGEGVGDGVSDGDGVTSLDAGRTGSDAPWAMRPDQTNVPTKDAQMRTAGQDRRPLLMHILPLIGPPDRSPLWPVLVIRSRA